MNEPSPARIDPAASLRDSLRVVRTRYDALDRGAKAVLRRCRTASEVELEATYWRVAGELARQQKHLAHLVLLFPNAEHRSSDRFSFGRFLRGAQGPSDGTTLRFRRALDSRDRDELDHRLRGLLRLAARDNGSVDWGVLGVDVLWFFAESGIVRRRWAQDFYAPVPSSLASVIDAESIHD